MSSAKSRSELLDNVGFSKEPSEVTAPSTEDIPEALREASDPVPQSEVTPQQARSPRVWLLGGAAGLGAIALLAGTWLAFGTQLFPSVAIFPNSSGARSTSQSTPTPTPAASTSTSDPNTLLGHFAYSEAPQKELQSITADGRFKLRKTAAQKYQQMVAAARSQGVILVPISGYRSISEQQYLFFDVKAQRGQVATERATVSAPPGYSEHHTGYAVDIGDGRVPATNLNPTFEKTAAFKWLSANAARYSFEMSFPKNNRQGVTYEPWHWRFVGDRHSLETFYKARKSNK